MKVRLVVFAILVAAPLRAQSNSAIDAMMRAVRAYQDLEFDVAASLLRHVLAPPHANELDDSTRARALTYLAAAEHYLGRSDSAIAVFRQLVVLAPRHQPDTLIFPPEVTQLYDAVRRSLPPDTVAPSAKQLAPLGVGQPVPPPAPAPAPIPVPVPQRDADRGSSPGPTRITATAAGLVLNVRARSEAGGVTRVNGTAVGLAGSVRFRRLELEVRYAEGRLQPSDGQSNPRDLVEGAVALRFVATPWLSMQLGPHARRYDSPLGAERWVTWQLGTRADVAITGPGVRGHALLWRGMGLGVNVPPGTGSAGGGEVGVTVDLGSQPFWFALVYGIDKAEVRDAARREIVETLTLTAGIRRR
jgi:hypothetical protein